MNNTLEPGAPRVGFCWDQGMPEPYPAMVHDTGKEIELVVPYIDSEVLRRRFIGRSVSWGDDPAYEQHDYTVPNVIWFADTSGHLCLIDPYRTRSTMIGRPDEGATSFRFAVATGNSGTDYSRINAVHSRLQGLNEWVRLGSIEHERNALADGSVRDVFTLKAPPPIPITARLNGQLEAWYSFKTSSRPGSSTIADGVRMATDVSHPRSWSEHLDVHTAVRQLLTVAGWQPYGFDSIEVQSRRDPTRSLAGTILASRWAPVLTHSLRNPGDVGDSRFLFAFEDIGPSGVRRWFKLRERHSRGVAGMIHSVGQSDAALETLFSEAAASMEDIGYQLGVELGINPGNRIREHLRRIVDELVTDVGFDLNEWRLELADAYRKVKHPEHPALDSLALLNLLRQTRLVFRVWVAQRLGASPAVIESNLQVVPMSRPYERL